MYRLLKHVVWIFFGICAALVIVFALYSGAEALCCGDLADIPAQLITAGSLNILAATVLSRVRFRQHGWRWVLWSLVLATCASLIWALAFWLARLAGIRDVQASVIGYVASLFALGVTGTVKIEELDTPPAQDAPGRRRRRR